MGTISQEEIRAFREYLLENERAQATVDKYVRAVSRFSDWLAGEGEAELTAKTILVYREQLLAAHLPRSVNGTLCAIRAFLVFSGRTDCMVRFVRVQREPFLDASRQLSQEEYRRLLAAARGAGQETLALVMETIAGTGIRISELRYFTVEAVRRGRITVRNKGKVRVILMPARLKERLLRHAGVHGIRGGVILRTKGGKPLDRSNIAHAMKRLCGAAGVDASKVFPHNLRHLFARVYYAETHNLSHLADILGHSSIETTRIYLSVSTAEQEKILGRLQLVS